MQPQEILNAVYTGILAQGGPSIGSTGAGFSICKYDNGVGHNESLAILNAATAYAIFQTKSEEKKTL